MVVRILPVDGPHVLRSAFCKWPMKRQQKH